MVRIPVSFDRPVETTTADQPATIRPPRILFWDTAFQGDSPPLVNPGRTDNIIFTVPAGKTWYPMSIYATSAADSHVANRMSRLTVIQGSRVSMKIWGHLFTASTSVDMLLFPGARISDLFAYGTVRSIRPLPILTLVGGDSICYSDGLEGTFSSDIHNCCLVVNEIDGIQFYS